MKKSLRMKIMLLLCALVVGSSSLWAQKITRKANIVSNTSYYIGATTGTPATDYYLQLPASSGDKGTAVTSTASATVFIFEAVAGKTDVYKIKIANTSNYLYTLPNSSSPNGKLTFGETAAEFTVSNLGTEGNYKIRLSNNSRSIQKNNSGTQFGSYGDTQTDVWLLPAASYTITAESNNTNYGTVSLLGAVITGSPKSGCRYATPAYTVSSGTATVSQVGNAFTVTPTSDCTITINFEAIPTHTLSSAVSPVDAGSVLLGSATVAEGATTTATAYANGGYKFSSWSISGTGASLSSPNTDNPITVTMGTDVATVTANFVAVKTYAITYIVNGVSNTVNVEENTAVDLSAPASALIPVGYVFKGWRTSTLPAQDTDPNDYVTSATSTADIIYYAVVALESFSDATWTLDYGKESDLSSSTSWGSYGTSYNYTASDGGTWTVKAYKNEGMQINTGKDCSIKIPSCSGSIKSIAITCSTAKAVGFSDSNYSGSGTISYVTYGTDATSQTLDFTGNSKTNGYIVPKAGSTSITKIVVTYKNPTYSGYCTTVSSVSISEDVTIAGDLNVNNYVLIVPDGKALTVNGTLTNTTPANLIIEDGGQLILAKTNTGVAATVKKDVYAATAGSKTDATHWYAISAGVENPSITGNTNIITGGGSPTYDLYRLNEEKNAGNAWENYRNDAYDDFDELTKGRGYLYRNASDLTITMTGDINVEDFTYDVTKTDDGEYAGFNLIGNPYTHDIYKGTGTAITNGTSTLSTGFYYLEPSTGKWAKGTDQSTAIAPNQGILVQVNETGNINMTNTNSNGSAKSHNDYIMLSVANSQYSDEAYAWFDKGIGLNKIEHRNSEIPMLYINQNGENFAIATMSDETQSFNLNFKAATMGKYTLSYETKGEYSYLHVIDRLTGEDVDMLMDGEYSFIASPIDSENRFIVRLEYSNVSENSENSIFAYQSGSDIIVNGEGELQIFDVMGRRISTQYVSGVETINLQLNGVFIFKLNEKTQKIVVR